MQSCQCQKYQKDMRISKKVLINLNMIPHSFNHTIDHLRSHEQVSSMLFSSFSIFVNT